MRKQLLGSVLVALLILVGCAPPQRMGGIPRKKHYARIVSLSPSTTELLTQLGAPLAGRTKACNYPDTVGKVEVVADLKPDYEKLAQIKPEIIVFDKFLYSDTEVKKLEQTGAETLSVGGDTLEDYIKEMYVVAHKIGGESAVMEYVDKIRRQRSVSEGEKSATPIKTVLIIPDASGHHMIAGAKCFQADMVNIMGGTLVGPDSNKFEPLNPEYLMAQNPDLIVVAGPTKTFLADTRFASLNAVKNLKMFGLDQDTILRRGSRIDTTIYQGHKALMLVTKGK